MKKKTMLQKLGLLGLVSFLSYTAAVVFAPLAYPDYRWMAQAVSDLSAADAPSLALWNQLSALYNACEVVCVTAVCLGMQGRKSGLLRTGIYAVCRNGVGLGSRLPDVPAVAPAAMREHFRTSCTWSSRPPWCCCRSPR